MNDWIKSLHLEPNIEGGYYRQTFETTRCVMTATGSRPLINSIYYLLTKESPKGYFHRNRSDITHFYHAGGRAMYLLISPAGELAQVTLGPDLSAGEVLAFTAPGSWWKSSHLPEGVEECLISEVTAPGFDYADHEMATLEMFERDFPDLVNRVRGYVLS